MVIFYINQTFTLTILFFSTFLISTTVLGQEVIKNSTFPEAETVFLNKDRLLDISMGAGGLVITEENNTSRKFYKNFNKHTHESIYYSDFDPVTELTAKVLIPRKGKPKSLAIKNFETKDIVQQGIFYGGYKRKEFKFPNVVPGAVGKLSYKKNISSAHFISSYYFKDIDPVISSEYTVLCDKSIELEYKAFGTGTSEIKFKKEEKGDRVSYSWTMTNVPGEEFEESAPSRSYYSPHVIVFVKSYQLAGKDYKVQGDVNDLYKWYQSLIKRIPNEKSKQLDTLVKTLVDPYQQDNEKIRAVYQWVQDNIKYVAFEKGMAGFVPRSAADVYIKRYGDCKDMANLMTYMLKSAGIDAHLAWIGTRKKPYSYKDVPCTITDNHMICAVKRDNNYMFLDATSAFASYGFPTSMIQGKEALIGLDEEHFELIKVPEMDMGKSSRADTVDTELIGDDIKGILSSKLTGYRKEDFEYKDMSAELKQDDNFIREYFQIGDNNIALDDLNITGLHNRNSHLNVSFSFKLPGYVRTVNDKKYINLNLIKHLPGRTIDIKERSLPIENDYKYQDTQIIRFKIPEGHEVAYLPENQQWNENGFGGEFIYKQNENEIILEKRYFFNKLMLEPAQFSEWNEMISVFSKANQETLVLVKKN